VCASRVRVVCEWILTLTHIESPSGGLIIATDGQMKLDTLNNTAVFMFDIATNREFIHSTK
jgi:hypothetical protein